MSVVANCMFIRVLATVDEYEFVMKERYSFMSVGKQELY
jgi:hypothetical protein